MAFSQNLLSFFLRDFAELIWSNSREHLDTDNDLTQKPSPQHVTYCNIRAHGFTKGRWFKSAPPDTKRR